MNILLQFTWIANNQRCEGSVIHIDNSKMKPKTGFRIKQIETTNQIFLSSNVVSHAILVLPMIRP